MKNLKLLAVSFFLLTVICSFAWTKTVKVGYYKDSAPFMNGMDENDPKGGYAYEYLSTIANYTGWKYEYHYGHFEQLYSMLLNGEIDLLADISYSKEREKLCNFPVHAMGSETYYLYINSPEKNIYSGNPQNLNGKTIAVGTGSYQYDLLKQWVKDNNVHLQILEFPYSEAPKEDFENGLYDLYLSIDTVASPAWEPLYKIGTSDIYLCVTKSRPDILAELNAAQNELYLTDPYYNNTLWTQYYSTVSQTKRLNEKEKDWINRHPVIKAGCIDNDMPFYGKDPKTGNIVGFVPDFMEQLSKKSGIRSKIEILAYPDYSTLLAALDSSEVDIIFPFIKELNFAETKGYLLSKPATYTSFNAIYTDSSFHDQKVKIAYINDTRSTIYAEKNKTAETVPCKSLKECLQLLMAGKVSCVISETNLIQKQIFTHREHKKINIIEMPGIEELTFAARRENYPVITILNKAILQSTEAELDKIITENSFFQRTYSFKTFLSDYMRLFIVWIIIFVVLLVSLVISVDRIKLLVNYDPMTHLLNRRRLKPYINSAVNKAKEKNEAFTIAIFDLDDFKQINDTYGHATGDEVLKMAASSILRGIKNGDYAFRWGGEEFLVIFKADSDVALQASERIRKEIEKQTIDADDKKINVTVTAGLAAYESGISYEKMFTIADNKLYEGKRTGKNKVVL